jgi:hypothetical protein
MKPRSHHPVKATKRSTKRPAKKVAKRARTVRGDDAVALAVGRALMRKPRVNPALLKAFQANRDLFAL